MTLARKHLIEARLQKAFAPLFLEVQDQSHLHVGHAGAQGGASHFALTIWASQFEDLSLLKTHQLIYKELNDLIPHEIHALKIKLQKP